MADRAIVLHVQAATPDSADSSITLTLGVQYFSDIGNMLFSYVEARMLWTDTAATWLTKMTTAIINFGTANGYTLAAAQIRIPSYIAGT